MRRPVLLSRLRRSVLRGDAGKAREVLRWAPTIDLAGVVRPRQVA